VLGIIGSGVMPVFVSVAVCAPTGIEGLYGSRWVAAAPLLVPLALGMPAYSVVCITGPVLWGIGRVERELRAEILTLVAAAIAYIVASRYSLVMLAGAVGIIAVLRCLLMTFAIRRVLQLQWRDIGGALRGGVIVVPLVAGCVWECDRLIGTAASPPARLAFDMLAGAVILAAVLLKCPKLLGKEAEQLLLAHSSGFPAFISRALVASRPEAGAAVAS
jgi:O-antigen/teichoic acid export membrane protein